MDKHFSISVFSPARGRFATVFKGLGLGLWVSHNIIEGHGGHIEVESKVGEGTTFTISLPAYQRER
jgi:signal transduction histidine kinase